MTKTLMRHDCSIDTCLASEYHQMESLESSLRYSMQITGDHIEGIRHWLGFEPTSFTTKEICSWRLSAHCTSLGRATALLAWSRFIVFIENWYESVILDSNGVRIIHSRFKAIEPEKFIKLTTQATFLCVLSLDAISTGSSVKRTLRIKAQDQGESQEVASWSTKVLFLG